VTFFTRAVQPRDDGSEPRDAAAPALEPSATEQASISLLCEWLRCWASVEAGDDASDAVARVCGLEIASRAAVDANRATEDADLSIHVQLDATTIALSAPLPIAESALGRVMTGVVRAHAGDRAELPSAATPTFSASIRVRPPGGSSPGEVGDERGARPLFVTRPRQILRERHPRWTIAYAVDRGVVCIPVNGTESVVVREDGRAESHHRWPRPILSELPFSGGFVAWASGRAVKPPVAPYVMRRRSANDEPTIEDLPFNPSWGAVWNERVHWGFLPSTVRPDRGLGSWAPGDARVELTSELAFFDLRPSDAGLLLEPSTRRPDMSYERRLLTEGWLWHPAHGLEPRALGPHGASGFRTTGHGWTVTTYPEADVVTLEAEDGTTRFLTVYYPLRAAWAGRSLVVSTVDEQILIFERFADELERTI
jgi:hypothetical protein